MTRQRLGVNIDHVATVRNARGAVWPDPLRAALLAEAAGADGITAHLREDRRHIRDADIEALMAGIHIPLNFECAATEEMQALALRQNQQASTAQNFVVRVRGQTQHAVRRGKHEPAEMVVGDVGKSVEHAEL